MSEACIRFGSFQKTTAAGANMCSTTFGTHKTYTRLQDKMRYHLDVKCGGEYHTYTPSFEAYVRGTPERV